MNGRACRRGSGRAPKVTRGRPQLMPDNPPPKDTELLLGGRLTTSRSGGPCARQCLGQEVLESQGALPGERPSLWPAPPLLRRGRPIVVPKSFGEGGGGGITEPRGFIGSHPPLSGSLTTAGLTGNYFLGEIFWRYLRADFWDFYGCIISGGPAGARLEGPWNRGARRRPPKLPLLSGMEP